MTSSKNLRESEVVRYWILRTCKWFVTSSRRIGHSGFTMAKVGVPCAFKNPSRKWRWRIISFIRTLLICGALERRRTETVPGTLTRSITLDIVVMSTMGRSYTEVCGSVLPNVPKIDCLVSKLALAFKMIQLILLFSCFLFSKWTKQCQKHFFV